MDDNLVQAYGRLTSHEFLLEILYAQLLAQMPEDSARAMKEQILKQMKNAYTHEATKPGMAESAGMTIVNDAAQMTEIFMDKVSRREHQIRLQIGKD